MKLDPVIVPQFAEPNQPHFAEAARLPNGLKGVSASRDWCRRSNTFNPLTSSMAENSQTYFSNILLRGIPILKCSQTDN